TGQENTGQENAGQEDADDDLRGEAAQWLAHARGLRGEIARGADAPPPAATPVTETTVVLRGGLEALEHAALTLRGLARSVLDSAGIDSECSPVRDRETRVQLASVLAKLGEAIRTYGRLVQLTPGGSESLESE